MAGTKQTLGQPRVLVVDDDRLVLSGIVGALEAAGFRVWAADSGEAALQLAEEVSPDVVVTDLRMPGMDGLTLLRHLDGARTGPRRLVIYSATPPAVSPARDPRDVLWIAKAPGHRALLDALKEDRHAT